MALKLFGGRVTIGKDLSQYVGTADNFYAIMQQRYGIDYKSRNKLKAYKNIVYACVSLIAESIGSYEPIIEKKNGDKWTAIDHEFLQLLNRPGGRDLKATSFSKFDLFEASAIYQLLQGEAYWYMALGKTTGKPREIIILRADKVGTDIDPKTGEINGYFIRQDIGEPIPLETNEVLCFPLFNPENPYKGKSVVEAGSDYIATDESTASFTKNFFENNAGLSGVLNVKGEVTKGAFRKFVRAWREKYQGVDNAGKVAIIRDSDASFTKVGLGLDELSMPDLRKMTLDDVLLMFKVPLPLLGKADQTGLGRGNVETLEYIFAKWNIDVKMKRFDSVLQFALERYYGVDNRTFRVVHKNIIPDDKEFILSERDKAVDRWQTRNEVRDEQGMNHVDGGDQLFIPLNNIPINESSVATPAPAAGGKAIKMKIIRHTEMPKKKDSSSTERFRLELMRIQARYERQFRKKFKPVIEAQRQDALDSLAAHASSQKEFDLFDNSEYDQEIVKALTPVLTDLASVQGALALVFAGDTEDEFLLTAPFKELLRQGTKMMAQGVNDTTIDQLNATLAEGIQQGEGIGALKARVNEVYDNLNSYRSERIARTETLKASNAATNWAYQQTGFVTQKQWVVNPDACPQCAEFDGKTVPLDNNFLEVGDSYTYTDANGEEQTVVNTYDTVEEPPLHPNCRCVIAPVI